MELSQETIKMIEDLFCKSFNALNGEEIDDPKQLTRLVTNGPDMVELFNHAFKELATKYEAAQKRAEELQAEVERMRNGLSNLRWGLFKNEDEVNSLIESLLNQKQ